MAGSNGPGPIRKPGRFPNSNTVGLWKVSLLISPVLYAKFFLKYAYKLCRISTRKPT